jgi:prepilin-type processing-associated H-X9-DG protein
MYSESIRGHGEISRVETPTGGDWFKPAASGATVDTVYGGCSGWSPTGSWGKPGFHFPCRGRNWVHGDYTTSRYNHIMPPNGLSCSLLSGPSGANALAINEDGAATTASSRHNGGVNIACADGSTHFVADSVDLAVWRALGSRNGTPPGTTLEEATSLDF